ncbi:uncharacterized protein LOC107054281 isoform X1 [Gallus gallus]|uniref:uncharacterized protein LOC107054281 isoform X1 n=1 Tax=Gallus gallus TaxID=9031 RepID=UPI001AE93859|nr:uncharacterized protein LOC107054281 isoform X1 [Gallus gallus]
MASDRAGVGYRCGTGSSTEAAGGSATAARRRGKEDGRSGIGDSRKKNSTEKCEKKRRGRSRPHAARSRPAGSFCSLLYRCRTGRQDRTYAKSFHCGTNTRNMIWKKGQGPECLSLILPLALLQTGVEEYLGAEKGTLLSLPSLQLWSERHCLQLTAVLTEDLLMSPTPQPEKQPGSQAIGIPRLSVI